jgi:hypothetical protein
VSPACRSGVVGAASEQSPAATALAHTA